MELRTSRTLLHYVEHGAGRPVLVLHGAGVDHREAEGCIEPAFAGADRFRRIYPDLPGMGRTAADGLDSAEDVVAVLCEFADRVAGGEPCLIVAHSAGAHFALGMAARRPAAVVGLALICPLLPNVRDVPQHRIIVGSGELGDETFRDYFVVQTPEMLERYERLVVPGMQLADEEAMERIGERWELALEVPFEGPALILVGRLDATVGYAAALDLAHRWSRATVVVSDGAGHALPHEKPELLRVLLQDWLKRCE
ncbi:alpha/beta fold hydrolase [Microbacterium sp. ZW T5_45]|uniref:alpha/beta fold hydrolase n=1 Tax=Microbacterium sp. ZW T5_45 TaxID=3378080 RepID=UPI00385553AA